MESIWEFLKPIQMTTVFEAKNFILEWKIQEWSFGTDQDIILDITDKEGEVHAHAMKTLLPKVNEVYTNTSTSHNSSKKKVNIDTIFHDEKFHFILCGGTELKCFEALWNIQQTMSEMYWIII